MTNNFRIKQLVPTIEYAFQQQAYIVIIVGHLGKPYGQVDPDFSLAPVAAELQSLVPDHHVLFINDFHQAQDACSQASKGDILVLENLRFHPEEEGYMPPSNDEPRKKVNKKEIQAFRTQLSKLADVYVNDAFGLSYRPHSSVTGVHVDDKVAGLHLQQELEYFAQVARQPERPFLAIFNNNTNKKTHVILSMMNKIDTLILCGGRIQKEDNENIFKKAEECQVKVLVPVDYVTGSEVKDIPEKIGYCGKKDDVPDGMIVLDCGHESSVLFRSEILKSKTIYWNGAPGHFELGSYFSKGSKSMLDAVVDATENGATSILSGRGIYNYITFR